MSDTSNAVKKIIFLISMIQNEILLIFHESTLWVSWFTSFTSLWDNEERIPNDLDVLNAHGNGKIKAQMQSISFCYVISGSSQAPLIG